MKKERGDVAVVVAYGEGEVDSETKRGRGDGLARWIDGGRRLECDGLLGNRSKVVKGNGVEVWRWRGVYGFLILQ